MNWWQLFFSLLFGVPLAGLCTVGLAGLVLSLRAPRRRTRARAWRPGTPSERITVSAR